MSENNSLANDSIFRFWGISDTAHFYTLRIARSGQANRSKSSLGAVKDRAHIS